MKKALIIFCSAIILFIAITAGLSFFERTHGSYPREIRLGGTLVHLTLAVTDREKEAGLSGFSSLSADQGMLFVFDRPDTWAFWMKGMQFPIDMIWLDRDGAVVDIKSAIDPSTYPEIFKPRSLASYVLEVQSGFAQKNNLTIGAHTEFLY
jgi:uncharacterized membrane protein (UPF0127 family)